MLSEGYIEKKCVKIAKDKGYNVRKVKFIQINGCPDRMFYKKGHFFFVEFKKEGGKTSAIQDYQINLLQEAGIEVHVIDNIEDFKKLIK